MLVATDTLLHQMHRHEPSIICAYHHHFFIYQNCQPETLWCQFVVRSNTNHWYHFQQNRQHLNHHHQSRILAVSISLLICAHRALCCSKRSHGQFLRLIYDGNVTWFQLCFKNCFKIKSVYHTHGSCDSLSIIQRSVQPLFVTLLPMWMMIHVIWSVDNDSKKLFMCNYNRVQTFCWDQYKFN